MIEDLDRIRRLREEALADWSRVGGDVSACALGRDGRSFPAFKFHEGRVAALGELLRAAPDTIDTDQLQALVAQLRARWAAAAALPNRTGPDWRAYHAGGLECLADLAGS